MSRTLTCVVVLLTSLRVLAADSPSDAPPARELGRAVDQLKASVDRLAGLLERDVSTRAEDREARRIEIATSIMGLRYRKIERLEGELQGATREAEDSVRGVELMKAQVDQLRKQGRSENGELTDGAKAEIVVAEVRVKSEEDRIVTLRERASVLQNDLAAERRRLTSLEAMLDAWMERQ